MWLGWYHVSWYYMMVFRSNSVLMICYSIQSPKYLNSKFKLNHKHMAGFLFNIIKEWVYDHTFIFLERALVVITIRIISESLSPCLCMCTSASEELIGGNISLLYLDVITLLKLGMSFLSSSWSAPQVCFIKCGFDRPLDPVAMWLPQAQGSYWGLGMLGALWKSTGFDLLVYPGWKFISKMNGRIWSA